MRIVVAVALHKPSPLPQDALYLPVQAGAALHPPVPGALPDDSGQHISPRNPLYCELTAHYWLWKQSDAEGCGLCHYRRYFTRRPFARSLSGVLGEKEAAALLQDADAIVPFPRLYLIETNASHFAHAHGAAPLALARETVRRQCPAYLPAFDRVMKRRWGRRFNMLIMRRACFNAYSAWLFGILGEVEEQLGSGAQERILGFLAERLLDVWLEHERPRLRQLRVMHTESQHWPRKIAGFLKRKFMTKCK